ncbi:hypothetical protein C8R41DRAFT_455513 [Lentinula lateritia]|uniref:Uncharacterized protein n=1 Tax=Lentinula lateritia TaxID=40482 RepID=A0ABQ8VC14_9AGAR|nr:hypothetical protein C8R41DRAFT_455513 [Lentinula lateritia]
MSFEITDVLRTWNTLNPQERNQLHRLSAEMTFHPLLIKDESTMRKLLAPALAAGSISDKDYAFAAARLGSLSNFYYFNYHHVGPAITAVVVCETGSLVLRKRPSAFIRGFFLFPLAFAAATLSTHSAIARRIDSIWEGLDNPLGVGKVIHARIRKNEQGVYSEPSSSDGLIPDFVSDTVESSFDGEPSKPLSSPEPPSPASPSSPSPPTQSNASNPNSRWDEIRAASKGQSAVSTWDEIRQQNARAQIPGTHDNQDRSSS